MARTDVNEGRGFPLAEEPAPVTMAPHRLLMLDLVRSALRSEWGVRMRQAQHAKTDYHAGRRSGYINAVGSLVEHLYGGDRDRAQERLKQALRLAGEELPLGTLVESGVRDELAKTIMESVLSVI